MVEVTDDELMNTDHWDYDHAEAREPVAQPRAVVSVSIPADDYALIARAAQKAGMKVSAYIREAAVGAATPKPIIVYGSGIVSCSSNGRVEVWQ